jgi:hypothetical protein
MGKMNEESKGVSVKSFQNEHGGVRAYEVPAENKI